MPFWVSFRGPRIFRVGGEGGRAEVEREVRGGGGEGRMELPQIVVPRTKNLHRLLSSMFVKIQVIY